MIKEVIVVEGKDDLAAIKKACQAEVITTNGLGITKETIEVIRNAQKRCGVIILTDPDYPGEKIRRIINEKVPGCANAYITNNKSKVGVEYATSTEILEALKNAHRTVSDKRVEFTMEDLYEYELIGSSNSSSIRAQLGQVLGFGKTNAKQFLNRLNAYGITRQEFNKAYRGIKE